MLEKNFIAESQDWTPDPLHVNQALYHFTPQLFIQLLEYYYNLHTYDVQHFCICQNQN